MVTLYEIAQVMEEEIIENIADAEDKPYHSDREREDYIERKVAEKLQNTYAINDKPLSDYDADDEFITAFKEHFIPADEWEKYLNYDRAVDYIRKNYWYDLLEALDIERDIAAGEEIRIPVQDVRNEMLQIIESDVDAYFEYVWEQEYEERA